MWTIKNLAFTRDDPNRRYLKSPLARQGRVVIGARKVPPGRTITVSEETYQKYARRIDAYVASGLIRTKQQLSAIPVEAEVAPVEVEAEVAPVEVVVEDTVSVEVVEAAPAEPAVELAPEPVPEDQTPEDPAPEPEPKKKKKMEPKSKRRTRAPKENG
jgi:hypothetical protein